VTFTFDQDSHVYRLDGVKLPGVTEILEYHHLTPNFPSGPYRVRGQRVHQACELHDKGVRFSVGGGIVGYLESYKRALQDSGFQWVGIEERLYHPTLCYAGTQDRRGWRLGKVCVADLKSGDTDEETGLQLAGYTLMDLTCPLVPQDEWLKQARRISQYSIERYKIRLFADGSKGKITQYEDPLDIDAWVGYVNTMRHELRGKRGTN
jgi:hypothetical protein